jgi:hypothetical protein
VRLAYAELATSAAGLPAPRLVLDYSFASYAWVVVGGPWLPDRIAVGPEPAPDFLAPGGGIYHRMPKVAKLA